MKHLALPQILSDMAKIGSNRLVVTNDQRRLVRLLSPAGEP
jgi:hypothetical protein